MHCIHGRPKIALLLEIRNRTDKNLASSGRKVGFKQAEVTTNYGLQTIDYTYDALARVTNASYFDGQLTSGTPTREYTFTYDKSSNRTNETLFLAGTQQYAHNFSYNGVNQLSSGGFTYDDNGNLTHDGSHSYTWDRANRLLTHNGSSYAYNGLGQRVSQTVSSVVTQYLQDTQPGLFKTIKATAGANTERYVHDPIGIHSHEANNGDWDWSLLDGLNSVRDVRNGIGNSVYSTQYAPYGEKFGLTGSNPTPFEYTGEPFDQNGLSYHRARYYDPSTGVWASQDSLETPNRYSYVMGNVINMTDLTGLVLQPINSCESPNIHLRKCSPALLYKDSRSGVGLDFFYNRLFNRYNIPDVPFIGSQSNSWQKNSANLDGYCLTEGEQIWTGENFALLIDENLYALPAKTVLQYADGQIIGVASNIERPMIWNINTSPGSLRPDSCKIGSTPFFDDYYRFSLGNQSLLFTPGNTECAFAYASSDVHYYEGEAAYTLPGTAAYDELIGMTYDELRVYLTDNTPCRTTISGIVSDLGKLTRDTILTFGPLFLAPEAAFIVSLSGCGSTSISQSSQPIDITTTSLLDLANYFCPTLFIPDLPSSLTLPIDTFFYMRGLSSYDKSSCS